MTAQTKRALQQLIQMIAEARDTPLLSCALSALVLFHVKAVGFHESSTVNLLRWAEQEVQGTVAEAIAAQLAMEFEGKRVGA